MTTQENRSTILEYIFRHAPVARSTIAKGTQITPATVTSITGQFIQEGVIQELGVDDNISDSAPGRKKILLDIIPEHVYSMGVEFTFRHVRFFISDLRGKSIFCSSMHVNETAKNNITQLLIDKITEILGDNPSVAQKLIGIGIAVPGHMDPQQDKVMVNSSAYPGFSGQELKEKLSRPIICENNVQCMSIGRYLFEPDSPETFAFFHISAGMFCALIDNGQLFRGPNYYAGEIGHTIVNPEGKKCECGKHGCLQTYCSETWILKYARMLHENKISAILPALKASSNALTIDDVSKAFSLGDPLIGNFISTALKYLGVTVSNLAIIINPEKIYLHSSLFSNPEICEELMDYIKRQLLFVDDPSDKTVQILPYNPYGGASGAAAYAIKHFYISTI